jgi:hypothetical protein
MKSIILFTIPLSVLAYAQWVPQPLSPERQSFRRIQDSRVPIQAMYARDEDVDPEFELYIRDASAKRERDFQDLYARYVQPKRVKHKGTKTRKSHKHKAANTNQNSGTPNTNQNQGGSSNQQPDKASQIISDIGQGVGVANTIVEDVENAVHNFMPLGGLFGRDADAEAEAEAYYYLISDD